ncbi:hypothetical protein SUGI_0498690 [Cryptomeria japonica]|uniref:non-specific lipid transfer protein GPI-anchored 19-like n=1 Tax=Cryptomeria japonica TaxID=3369 RepID=UPI002408CE2C|nr:non-specific lipid transfer protein GPI-anchored 19-like [Cryptomeria japonica]GLJ25996.1 hypothetical protein SUGI_0498690 [Cryptomeria japonica]
MAGIMECTQRLLSVILTVLVIIAGVTNYGGALAQSSECSTSLQTLFPCMGYVATNVSSSPPSQGCCTALASVMQGNKACLCQLFTTNNPLGMPIDQTNAMSMPGACNIPTPLPQCNVAGDLAPSPSTEVPTSSPPIDSSAPTTTETAPSYSPAVSPSSNSPSLPPTPSIRGISPTASKKPTSPPLHSPITSVRGVSPRASEKRTSMAGALFTPSMITSALAVTMVVISIL